MPANVSEQFRNLKGGKTGANPNVHQQANGQTLIYLYDGTRVSSTQKQTTSTPTSMDESQKHAECKKPGTEGDICMIQFIGNLKAGETPLP